MSVDPSSSIAYATPVVRPPARTFAATVIVVAGLALVVLGGCFLIGVMYTVGHLDGNLAWHSRPLSLEEWLFSTLLTVCAIASFAGAVTLLVIGTRGLLRIIAS